MVCAMIDIIKNIHWGALSYSIWLPVVLGAMFVVWYRVYKRRAAYVLLAGKHASQLLSVSIKKQNIKSILLCGTFLLLFIALLRPQWNKIDNRVTEQGRDLYVALDISRSMLAIDCHPNRLIYAKNKIKKLLTKLSCERVGLILFSGTAFVQCPLTSDYSAFYLYLDAVDAELISSGTTALDKAIEQALLSFSTSVERKNKLLVIFTDGEDFSHNLSTIKKEAAQNNLSIFTIGIGSIEGAPVPLFDHNGNQIGHQKDRNGNVVISRLNEGILQTLSYDAGGHYSKATEDDSDITSFVSCVEAREKEALAERTYQQYEDQYHYFLIMAFVCLVLEWLL